MTSSDMSGFNNLKDVRYPPNPYMEGKGGDHTPKSNGYRVSRPGTPNNNALPDKQKPTMEKKSNAKPRTQVVNVSGTLFEMSEETWVQLRKSMPDESAKHVKQTESEVFLERHAGVFQSILYFRQGGELHLPVDVCPSSFKKELAFYGVDELYMAKCCFTKYINYFDDQDVLKILENDETQKKTETEALVHMKKKGGWKGIQAVVWLVLNEPFYSKAAKIYFVISAVVVTVSLFALIVGTHPSFHRDLNIEEWKSYFGEDWDKYKYHFTGEPKPEAETETEPETGTEPETETETEPVTETETEPEIEVEPETGTEPETTGEPETNPEVETTGEPETNVEPEAEIPIPENAFVRFTWLEYTEHITTVIFTIDLLLRLLFCPFPKTLLVSFLNWVDIFALTVMYAKYIIEALYPREKYEASALDILHCLQIVRVFRLLRLVKNFVGFRVLVYAFKASIKEMMLMSMFLFIAMLMFSTFAFFSGDDTFTSIPDSFWWAIVTMTTVGYGDVVPKEDLSRFIGVICAVSGVCLIAVIIPIFVNNFMLFYSYSKVWGKQLDNKDEEEEQVVKKD